MVLTPHGSVFFYTVAMKNVSTAAVWPQDCPKASCSPPLLLRNKSWVRNPPTKCLGGTKGNWIAGSSVWIPQHLLILPIMEERTWELGMGVHLSPCPRLLRDGVFSASKDHSVTTTLTNFCSSRPSRRRCPEGWDKYHQVISLPNVTFWVEVESHFLLLFLGKCIYPYQSSPEELLAEESPKPATTQENAFC